MNKARPYCWYHLQSALHAIFPMLKENLDNGAEIVVKCGFTTFCKTQLFFNISDTEAVPQHLVTLLNNMAS